MFGVVSLDQSPIRVRHITLEHPWQWLSAAWADMANAPVVSLTYGGVFALVGFLLMYGLESLGAGYLSLPLALGFAIVAPAAAVGLYETSRRLSRGEPATLMAALTAVGRNPGQIGLLGVFLVIILLAWTRLAMLEFMLFFGAAPPSVDDLVGAILLSDQAFPFLLVGFLSGGAMALGVFTITAVAVPMLVDRKVDAVTAMLASLEAVKVNPKPMLLWAFLIAMFTLFGLGLFLIGLVLTLPLVGHASWHAYRDLIDPGA
jgi:uncharacterized membrane protein